MKKKNILYVTALAKYLLLSGCFIVLVHARVDTAIAPFAAVLLFTCIFMPVKSWVAAIIFFVSSLFVEASQPQILCNIFTVAIFVLFAILIKRSDKIKNLVGVLIAYVFSNGFNVFTNYGKQELFYKAIISVLIGMVFLSCVIVLINTVKIKRAKIPWTIDQKICAAAFITIFALGLSGFDYEYFSVHKFVSIYIILTSIYLFDAKNTLVVAVCLGLGQSLIALNLNYVAIYTLLCAVAMAFKSKNTAYSIIALVFTDIVLGTYFNAYIIYDFYSVLPVIAAICVFVIMPSNFAKRFHFDMASLNGNFVSKNTINKNRAGVYARLNSLAAVFAELQNTYRSLIHADVPVNEIKLLIAGQVRAAVCENCPNRANCMSDTVTYDGIKDSFAAVAYLGLSRGSVNFLDIPQSLTIKCTRMNSVLSTTNSLLKERAEREAISEKLDTGKILMAQFLAGLNKLMVQFATDVCSDVVFDNDMADLIKEELLYRNIVASDCLIVKTALNEYTVSVLVSRADSRNRAIEQIISRVVKHKMQLDSVDDSETAGFAIVTVKTAPRYQVLFGVAQITKNFGEACGDIYSFLKINNEKTLMAVCDGMGAGAGAEKAATLALSLVENFYKAGFPNEMIMTTVNQLLQISAGDVFSALDIAVFNMGDGSVDFIKVGASDGFIKRADTVEVVEAGSLPIGVLDEMQPKITRTVLQTSNMVVLTSDGVSDSFGGRVSLANFINNLALENPQEMADTIIQECLNRSGRIAGDDSTVVVGRLIQR